MTVTQENYDSGWDSERGYDQGMNQGYPKQPVDQRACHNFVKPVRYM